MKALQDSFLQTKINKKDFISYIGSLKTFRGYECFIKITKNRMFIMF